MSAVRVLVVDDARAIRAIIAGMLAEVGHVPVLAANAEDAVALAAAERPDVALIDHHLPGLSGAQLIRCFRGSSDAWVRGVPVIGLSGFPDRHRALMEAGACCMLWKPVAAVSLLKAVQWAIDVYGRRG